MSFPLQIGPASSRRATPHDPPPFFVPHRPGPVPRTRLQRGVATDVFFGVGVADVWSGACDGRTWFSGGSLDGWFGPFFLAFSRYL